MIRRPNYVLWCIASLAFGLTSETAAAQGKVPDFYAVVKRQPLTFFVAKGSPNACGPGCSEWIAAEGMIDLDAAQRFRDFLGGLPRRDLPVFWNSTGGNARQSILLGAILREHRMTAAVGRSIPEGCRSSIPIDDACRRVMQSKREHKARLVTGGARCISGCVYALLGGSLRQVARDAQLGIHSVRVLPLPGVTPSGPPPKVEDIHQLLKRYVVEMGVDPGLIDAAAKVSADSVRFMSRDEIARFGVETQGFYETPWLAYKDREKKPLLLKSITQVGADGKDYRTSSVRMWCVGGGYWIWFGYDRELSSKEIGAKSAVRVAAGDSELVLARTTKVTADQRIARANLDFLRTAGAVPSIVISETFRMEAGVQGQPHVVKVSTKGLSKAAEWLAKDCSLPSPANATVVGGGH